MNKRVIIIGGGIVGCLSALEFKKKGFDVTIIEKSKIGQESSSAAAGILYPLMPWKYDDTVHEFSLGASKFYSELSKKFLRDFGRDIEFITSGLILLPPYNEHEVQEWSKKNKTNILKNHNSILIPGVSQLNPKELMLSLKDYLNKIRIKIYENLSVLKMDTNNNIINAVYTDDHKKHISDVFVLSAGAWSSIINKKLIRKIKPIRGQIIQYSGKNLKLNNILYSDGMYIFQRKNSSIIVGSTLEDVGFSDQNLDEKIDELDTKAKEILVDLKKCSIDKTWYGFRPGVENNLPIISKDEKYENMFIHSGHYRYGITMAPATTKILMSYF